MVNFLYYFGSFWLSTILASVIWNHTLVNIAAMANVLCFIVAINIFYLIDPTFMKFIVYVFNLGDPCLMGVMSDIIYVFFINIFKTSYSSFLVETSYPIPDSINTNVTILSSILIISSNFRLGKNNHLFFTIVSKQVNIILNIRTMFFIKRTGTTVAQEITLSSNSTRTMSYLNPQKFLGAAKKLANDHGTKHTHVVKTNCTNEDCDTKKCPNICDDAKTHGILGHNTHKPPVGRMARFISPDDAKGESNAQYFVRSNNKVEFSEEEKKKYGNQIKEDSKQKDFIHKYTDKYDQ